MLRELLHRAAAGEDINHLLTIAESWDDVAESRSNLQRVIQHYDYDMTGQDGEDEIDAAAADYIQAQDMALKSRDPEWYHEKKQMGCL